MNSQKGVVIVVALFIVAMVAMMAYLMMSRLERDTRRTSLILRNTQAEYFAQGSIAWAIDTLRNNWEKQNPARPIDEMPIASPVIDVQGYRINSTIYDMQARFNINSLANSNGESRADFKHLLQIVAPQLGEEKIKSIVNALTDWMTPQTQDNEFSKYYLSLPNPYRAAHRAMVSVGELNLISGMSKELYHALKPFVIALPTQTKINIRTAPVEVLATLSPLMTLDGAKAFAKLRKEKPMNTVQDFLENEALKKYNILPEKVEINSNYFLVETKVTIEKQNVVLYTLLERVSNDGGVSVNTLWQSKGLW